MMWPTHPLRNVVLYVLAFAPAILGLMIANAQTYVPLAFLMKDPLAVAEITGEKCCSVYYGLFSNIGILMWCGAAAITLFAAMLLFLKRGITAEAIALAAAGVLTTWLMLDDFFLVHEDVLPAFGVSQTITYAIYGSVTLGYFALAWRTIWESVPSLLALSVAFLGLSVLSDTLLHTESHMHILVEDGAKLLGISAWAAFHINLAFEMLEQALAQNAVFMRQERPARMRSDLGRRGALAQ